MKCCRKLFRDAPLYTHLITELTSSDSQLLIKVMSLSANLILGEGDKMDACFNVSLF